MKHSILRIFSIILLTTQLLVFQLQTKSSETFGFPFFKQRSQCLNIPRRMVGEVHHLFRPCLKEINGSLSVTPQYMSNFNRKDIGEYLFFNGTNTMKFGPANINGSNPDTDVAASQFLMGEGFQSTITTEPKVRNFIMDFGVRIGFDNWVQNLYLDVQAPFNVTEWDLSLVESPIATGTLIPVGQLGNNLVPLPSPFECIRESWNGNGIIAQVNDTMNFARVCGAQDEIRLADMQFTLGYNFINCHEKHLGVNLRIIAPTGNGPKGVYFFEPISGGGKHTYVGGGMDGHFELYHNCSQQEAITFYFFGAFYHMFGSSEKRTFDLKQNGIGSRYLLFKRFDGFGNYDNTIVRGPNVLTLDANVSVGGVGEGVILVSYERKNMTFDTGYNLWARSHESITQKEEILCDTFGIKGNTNTLTGPLLPGQMSSINQTASKSRIDGTNFDDFDDEPVFITMDDINFAGAESPGALSHTLFGHLSFTWEHDEYLSSFWGVGGQLEFSGKQNTALNQWSVWTKGGIFFS